MTKKSFLAVMVGLLVDFPEIQMFFVTGVQLVYSIVDVLWQPKIIMIAW